MILHSLLHIVARQHINIAERSLLHMCNLSGDHCTKFQFECVNHDLANAKSSKRFEFRKMACSTYINAFSEKITRNFENGSFRHFFYNLKCLILIYITPSSIFLSAL